MSYFHSFQLLSDDLVLPLPSYFAVIIMPTQPACYNFAFYFHYISIVPYSCIRSMS